ncbi:hypothetical protein Glove_30g20 [Diversispora epigaea]|uniref:Phosphatidic acid phosphatase type 2/haloperoxidase domain-containing protein n=1 Tax=Diversispora epigaea TaxID=1348612 RepID=A0A397JJI5_9GLOM|nr:hypothetical protein Glove_30g20 [Diversispora epigaea]
MLSLFKEPLSFKTINLKSLKSCATRLIKRNITHFLYNHNWSIYDLQYVFLLVLGGFLFYIIENPFILKTVIVFIFIFGLYFRTTRTFFVPFLPIAAWLILFYSCRFIPGSSRPHIYVSVLPALENILYGDNLSAIIATNTNILKDVLAWLPYGVFHFMLPFLTSLGLWWFGPPGILAVFSRAFGYMNIAGVLTQLAFPCSPPWYEYVHGMNTPASYTMRGDPGGLARIDELFNSNTYSLTFGGSPMVFGAFPSLHSGCAIIQALFISHLLPKTRPIWFAYVLWIWWACMYLTHHYMVDLVGGGIYAFVTFWISWNYLPKINHENYNRWDYIINDNTKNEENSIMMTSRKSSMNDISNSDYDVEIEIASSTLCEEDLDLINNKSNSSSIEDIIIIKN